MTAPIIMERVHNALLPHGDAGATAPVVAEATGLSIYQIVSACTRGVGRWFREVGETTRGQPKTWRAIPDPKRPQEFTPIRGAGRWFDENSALAGSPIVTSDTCGNFEVRYTNRHGYVICQPCRSLAWARQLAAECGGKIEER